jgi:hypothetical protein
LRVNGVEAGGFGCAIAYASVIKTGVYAKRSRLHDAADAVSNAAGY